MAHDEPPGPGRGKRKRVPVAERKERLAELVQVRTPLSESQAELFLEVYPVIMDLHYGMVWTQIRRRGVNETDAEDLVLDVFELFHRLTCAEGFPDCIPAKLRTLTRGKVRNHVRDEGRVPFSLGLPSSRSQLPPSGPGVDSAAAYKDLALMVLPQLSDDHADVVELVIIDRLSHAEAADELNIPLGTLKSRVRAAKERLLELVKEILRPSQWPKP